MTVALLALLLLPQDEALAQKFSDTVRRVNEEHAAKPGKTREPELAKRLPKDVLALTDKLANSTNAAALILAGEAALDLDLMPAFDKIRRRLEKVSPADAQELGAALSRDRYILRGIRLDDAYLARFAKVMDAVLDAYDELFAFAEWSKVPGKKLRVRIHLEEEIKRPPHFAPQFPFHSEIDFPVIDAKELKSPTPQGQFLFYGLCHELGHVIAMWGNRAKEEDHHAWAHYTGVAIVEHLSKGKSDALDGLADAKWRGLDLERKKLRDVKPSTADRDGVVALFIALHDRLGPKAIGAALNALDAEDKRLRLNRVRYYGFAELKAALMKTLMDPKARAFVKETLP